MEKIQKLPSEHQTRDEVDIDFGNTHYLKNCFVAAVIFHDNGNPSIYYDVMVPVGFETDFTILKEMEARFVKKSNP